MKKCPFCAEEIQSEAIYCRYCNQWLNNHADGKETDIWDYLIPIDQTNIQAINPENEKVTSTQYHYDESLSRKQKAGLWVALIIICSIIYGTAIYQFLIGNIQDVDFLNVVGTVFVILSIIFIYNFLKNISNLHLVVKFILALVFAYLLNLLVGFICGFLLGFQAGFWTNFNNVSQEDRNFQVMVTPTIKPTIRHLSKLSSGQTATAISSYNRTQVHKSKNPTSSPQIETNCRNWSDVSFDDLGVSMCVYGNAIDTFSKDGAFYVVFGKDPKDFYFISYGEGWYEDMRGNCVLAKGEIKQLGKAPVMVVEDNGFFHCN